MSLNRFYIAPETWNPEALVLTGADAHHCREVMRHSEGDKLVVFNGQGVEAMTRIESMTRDEVTLDTQNVTRAAPLPIEITLAQAVMIGAERAKPRNQALKM